MKFLQQKTEKPHHSPTQKTIGINLPSGWNRFVAIARKRCLFCIIMSWSCSAARMALLPQSLLSTQDLKAKHNDTLPPIFSHSCSVSGVFETC